MSRVQSDKRRHSCQRRSEPTEAGRRLLVDTVVFLLCAVSIILANMPQAWQWTGLSGWREKGNVTKLSTKSQLDEKRDTEAKKHVMKKAKMTGSKFNRRKAWRGKYQWGKLSSANGVWPVWFYVLGMKSNIWLAHAGVLFGIVEVFLRVISAHWGEKNKCR